MSLIDSINTTTEINSGNDRFVKGSFDIKIKGYIIPDVIQKDMNSNMIYSVEQTKKDSKGNPIGTLYDMTGAKSSFDEQGKPIGKAFNDNQKQRLDSVIGDTWRYMAGLYSSIHCERLL